MSPLGLSGQKIRLMHAVGEKRENVSIYSYIWVGETQIRARLQYAKILNGQDNFKCSLNYHSIGTTWSCSIV